MHENGDTWDQVLDKNKDAWCERESRTGERGFADERNGMRSKYVVLSVRTKGCDEDVESCRYIAVELTRVSDQQVIAWRGQKG